MFLNHVKRELTKTTYSNVILCTKALSKQEGPNFCWDARFFNRLFESAACCKKRIQKTSILTNVWPFLFCQGFSTFRTNFSKKSGKLLQHQRVLVPHISKSKITTVWNPRNFGIYYNFFKPDILQIQ